MIMLAAATIAAPPAGQVQTADCAVTFERASEPPARPLFRLRPACPLGPESTRQAMHTLLAAAPAGAAEVSVFLGRAIEYPWISALIVRQAVASREWNSGSDHAARGGDNRAVARLLLEAPQLAQAFAGWTLAGVSVEKVLVRPAQDLDLATGAAPATQLPYDAQIWVRLRR